MGNLTTTNNQLSTLRQRIIAASDRLAPASEDLIAARLIALQNAGMKFDPSLQNAARSYAFALKNIPGEAYKAVTNKLIQGAYKRRNHDFIPIPSEMAALCRDEARTLIDDAARLREIAATLSEQRRPIPEEERARVRARIAEIRTQRQIDKATQGLEPEQPLTDEEAERLKAILALPDRAEITPENLAYRSAIVDRMPE